MENRLSKGPTRILYRVDGTSTRAMASEDEKALDRLRVTAMESRDEEGNLDKMPSTEVVKHCRRNECVSSSVRLEKAVKNKHALVTRNQCASNTDRY